MKKNNSLRIFNLLAKRVHRLSKKRNLGWTWSESQKWTSKNLFQLYKGKSISKIKLTEVDSVAIQILSKPEGTTNIPAPETEICDSVFQIPSSDLEPVNWWDFPDKVNSFPPLVNIKIDLSPFLETDITKRNLLPNLTDVREDFRKRNSSSNIIIVFKILVRPKRKDDGKNCSYYVLATFEDSVLDNYTKNKEIDVFVSEKDITEERQNERRKKEEQKEIEKKRTKKEIKSQERPQQVEVKTEPDKKIVIEPDRLQRLENILNILKDDLKSGLITKKQYRKMADNLFSRFERGGKI